MTHCVPGNAKKFKRIIKRNFPFNGMTKKKIPTAGLQRAHRPREPDDVPDIRLPKPRLPGDATHP